MIKTGLPYKMQEISEISLNGASVDMSTLCFPTIEKDKQIDTALIFLRNTGFKNVSLVFDKCDYKMKSEYLNAYLTTDIVTNNEEFSDAAISVLNFFILNKESSIESFMNAEDCKRFIEEEKEMLNKLVQILVSVPVYSMFRLKTKGEIFSMDDIASTDDETIGINFMNLLRYPDMQFILPLINKSPLFYTKFFTEDNNELFDKIAESKLGIAEILYGFETIEPENFATIFKEMDGLIERIILEEKRQLAEN